MRWMALVALVALVPTAAAAQLVYQGELTDLDGVPVDGVETFTFALYPQAEGGEALWSEAHEDVPVVDGAFVVVLGGAQSFTPEDFATATWLGVTRLGAGEMAPRQRVGEVPAAVVARDVIGDIHPRSISVGGALVVGPDGAWIGPVAPEALDPRLDRDGDGWPDSAEVAVGADPDDPDDAPRDADDDGVPDALRGPPGPAGPPGEPAPVPEPPAPPGPIGVLRLHLADGAVDLPVLEAAFGVSRSLEGAGGGGREVARAVVSPLQVSLADHPRLLEVARLMAADDEITAELLLGDADPPRRILSLTGAIVREFSIHFPGGAGPSAATASVSGRRVDLADACGFSIVENRFHAGGCPDVAAISEWVLPAGAPLPELAAHQRAVLTADFGLSRPVSAERVDPLASTGLIIEMPLPDTGLLAWLLRRATGASLPAVQTLRVVAADAGTRTLILRDPVIESLNLRLSPDRSTLSVGLNPARIDAELTAPAGASRFSFDFVRNLVPPSP
jgi:hypothetical protein